MSDHRDDEWIDGWDQVRAGPDEFTRYAQEHAEQKKLIKKQINVISTQKRISYLLVLLLISLSIFSFTMILCYQHEHEHTKMVEQETVGACRDILIAEDSQCTKEKQEIGRSLNFASNRL